MTTVEECPKCHLPVFPCASEDMKRMGTICACASTIPRHAARMPVETPQQAKGVPDLEQLYLDILEAHAPDLPKPLRHQEVIPGRGFQMDFYWPIGRGLVVEIDGNVHRIKHRFLSDVDKHNLLTITNTVYLRFTGRMLRHRIVDVIALTREGLERARK